MSGAEEFFPPLTEAKNCVREFRRRLGFGKGYKIVNRKIEMVEYVSIERVDIGRHLKAEVPVDMF